LGLLGERHGVAQDDALPLQESEERLESDVEPLHGAGRDLAAYLRRLVVQMVQVGPDVQGPRVAGERPVRVRTQEGREAAKNLVVPNERLGRQVQRTAAHLEKLDGSGVGLLRLVQARGVYAFHVALS